MASEGDPLATMGLAGWVISGLAAAVVTLASAIGLQWRTGNDNQKARITDAASANQSLQKLLVDTNTALNAVVEASKRRNEVTEQLAALIAEQSNGFRLFAEQFKYQQETVNRDLEHAIDAVQALAASVRVLSEESKTVHVKVTAVQAGVEAVLKSRR